MRDRPAPIAHAERHMPAAVLPSPPALLSVAGLAMSRGLIVFDSDARVRSINQAAARMLDEHATFTLMPMPGVPGGAMRLVSSDAELHAMIEEAVHDCAASSALPALGTDAARSVRTLHIKSARHALPGLVLHMWAPRAQEQLAIGAEVTVLGTLTELRRQTRLDCQCLVDLFDLSASSARVAEAYLRADSVKEVARQLGISTNTVKTHLAAVYLRTGCARQAQLVRLLMAISNSARA